jgi:DNA sulfur modification protein DndE
LKSGKDEEGRKLGRPTQDVAIDHCTVFRGHGGLSIGSEMSGGVSDIHLTHCVFDGTDVGLRLKSTRGRGGVVENIVASDVDMYNIAGPAISFDMYYMVKDPQPEPVSERTPRFRNFQISNIDCDGAKSAVFVRGLPEMPIENVSLNNVTIHADRGVTCTDAQGIVFHNVAVTTGLSSETLNQTVDTTQIASHTWQDASGQIAQVSGNGG